MTFITQNPVRNENFSLVLNTSRQIENMKVSNWKSSVHQDLIELLEKFGPNLQKLWFEGGRASLSELREYLQLVPKITRLHLDLYIEDSIEENEQSPLDLNELRELKVECNNDDPLKFLTRLPPNVLTKLEQNSFNFSSFRSWDDMETLLINQRNIKQLSMSFDSFMNIPEGLIDCLDLERLSWFVLGNDNEKALQFLVNMTSKQTNLTHLKTYSVALNDKMLQTIVSSLKKLEVFEINISNLSAQGIKVIDKLPKLKELSLLKSCGNDVLCSFAELNNSRLEVLKFPFYFNLHSNAIADIARSAPNLKHLVIYEAENFQVLLSVMQNFRRIESLPVEELRDSGNVELLLESECKNEHLKELSLNMVYVPYAFPHIKKLIENFPNLEKLKLCLGGVRERSMLPDLRVMLKSWKKLTHLTLNCESEPNLFVIEDLDIFLDYGKHLKFIAMHNINLTEEDREKIRDWYCETFSVIEFKEDPDNWIMARDYKTRYEDEI
jgi:hypothetical protein